MPTDHPSFLFVQAYLRQEIEHNPDRIVGKFFYVLSERSKELLDFCERNKYTKPEDIVLTSAERYALSRAGTHNFQQEFAQESAEFNGKINRRESFTEMVDKGSKVLFGVGALASFAGIVTNTVGDFKEARGADDIDKTKANDVKLVNERQKIELEERQNIGIKDTAEIRKKAQDLTEEIDNNSDKRQKASRKQSEGRALSEDGLKIAGAGVGIMLLGGIAAWVASEAGRETEIVKLQEQQEKHERIADTHRDRRFVGLPAMLIELNDKLQNELDKMRGPSSGRGIA